WVLVGIMIGSFLERQVAQPTNVVRKIEADNAQRTQSAAAEQKPPAPHKYTCLLRSIASSADARDAPLGDAGVLYYPDDTPDCLHRPQVDPSWHRGLLWHLHQYRNYWHVPQH